MLTLFFFSVGVEAFVTGPSQISSFFSLLYDLYTLYLYICLPDLPFVGMPTRWTAPESFLRGTYNVQSDTWMANMMADEILNYAAWPFSEYGEQPLDVLMKNVIQ